MYSQTFGWPDLIAFALASLFLLGAGEVVSRRRK